MLSPRSSVANSSQVNRSSWPGLLLREFSAQGVLPFPFCLIRLESAICGTFKIRRLACELQFCLPADTEVGLTLGFDLLKDLSLCILPATPSENVSIMT